jgi:hypothetical protein
MQTTLYVFQRRSLAAMLRQEERNPPPMPDPLFVTLADREGGALFYDVVHGLVVSKRPEMAPVRGGILYENTGKCTCQFFHSIYQYSLLFNYRKRKDNYPPNIICLVDTSGTKAVQSASHSSAPAIPLWNLWHYSPVER